MKERTRKQKKKRTDTADGRAGFECARRGGFCVHPITGPGRVRAATEAAIDYFKRSAACPGKLRHSRAPPPPSRVQRGPPATTASERTDGRSGSQPAAKQCARHRRHGGTNTPTLGVLVIPTPVCPSFPSYNYDGRPPSRNIFCPESKRRHRRHYRRRRRCISFSSPQHDTHTRTCITSISRPRKMFVSACVCIN